MYSRSFRPLLGFFISKSLQTLLLSCRLAVFVPCWGSLFQNKNARHYIMLAMCFRPLLGFFISKYFNDVAHLICIVVFVPCWGSLFQNFSTIPHKAESENRFRPLLGFFISKSCPLHPRNFVGFQTTLRRKSQSRWKRLKKHLRKFGKRWFFVHRRKIRFSHYILPVIWEHFITISLRLRIT